MDSKLIIEFSDNIETTENTSDNDNIDDVEVNERKLKTKEYNKIYHSTSEHFISNHKNAKKKCKCGKVISRLNYFHHIKCKYHINTMQKINEIIMRYEKV